MQTLLQNTFYSIKEISNTEDSIKACVAIHPTHEVFKGHFPQMPVVPGVCQVQIIKELLEQTINKSTMMVAGDNIKFTGMILPDKHPTVNLEMTFKNSEGVLTVDAKLFSGEIVFTKYKGKFKILD